MRKAKIFSAILAVLTLLFLVACGENEAPEGGAGNADNGAHVHTPGIAVEENLVEATCTEDGYCDKVVYCNTCSTELSRTAVSIPASHNYVSGKCSACTAVIYTRQENKILFGTYPQSEVTDIDLQTELTEKAGAIPTSTGAGKWTSYGYYVSEKTSDYMWYIDVEQNGEKYRGVYFDSYRPFFCGDEFDANNTFQDDNGYNVKIVYWFKYEPISWTILNEKNGKSLILCDMIIDSQQYDYKDGNCSNNYAESTIRAWLNETFLQTAFSALEQGVIETTLVDNSASSAGSISHPYTCEDTRDKVFLLSYKEVTDSAYGFSSNYTDYDEARRMKPSDYAQSQGAWTITDSSYGSAGIWWLRSPCFYQTFGEDDYVRQIANVGCVYDANLACHTCYGVVPALWIRL